MVGIRSILRKFTIKRKKEKRKKKQGSSRPVYLKLKSHRQFFSAEWTIWDGRNKGNLTNGTADLDNLVKTLISSSKEEILI